MVSNLDLEADQRTLSDDEVSFRSKTILDLWALLRVKDAQLSQKLRV